jgi:hypothetical protein
MPAGDTETELTLQHLYDMKAAANAIAGILHLNPHLGLIRSAPPLPSRFAKAQALQTYLSETGH